MLSSRGASSTSRRRTDAEIIGTFFWKSHAQLLIALFSRTAYFV